MKPTAYCAIAVAALLPVAAACGDDDDDGLEPGTNFSATLSGTEEDPPVVTDATGTATLSVADGQITYTITVENLENAVVSHIHVAPPGENGPVRMNLCGTGAPLPDCVSGTGVLASGSNGETIDMTFDELVAAMQTGNAYVNVHTDDGAPPPNTGAGDMASGEIRGQIVAD
ncbi:MAG TPA: CHRD domain-containing protein [Thermomicrobiales bacterium]|nr:CHRD domain-containing protein [Thermomicrobiales bacterium]